MSLPLTRATTSADADVSELQPVASAKASSPKSVTGFTKTPLLKHKIVAQGGGWGRRRLSPVSEIQETGDRHSVPNMPHAILFFHLTEEIALMARCEICSK